MKTTVRRIFLCIITAILITSMFSQALVEAKTDCKSLCKAALQETGNGESIKYTSSNAADFGGLSYSMRKKVKKIYYLCDEKEAHSLCVMEAKNASAAKALVKAMKSYKKRNTGSDYLSDYSQEEQSVFQNAIYGSKKKIVWYIAMSADKADNMNGQASIKKKI